MNIGEKIIYLRNFYKISQDDLALKMKVTRQAISKWESNESNPTISNILELSKLFNVTTDELIDSERIINKSTKEEAIKGKLKYFGTDGFRGEANKTLSAKKAFRIGRFLGWYYSNPKNLNKNVIGKFQPKVIIGKDTRMSSYMFEYAIAAGLSSSGANVYLLHVTTSPSISYFVRREGYDIGIMITASHNPFYDNGIKILNQDGEKLDDKTLLLIEAYIQHNMDALDVHDKEIPYSLKDNIGVIKDYENEKNRYLGYLLSTVRHSFSSLRIGLDPANGASYMLSERLFKSLGAKVIMINNNPNGLNVNLNAGSTHIEGLVKLVKDNKLDVGFAYDGDADRCLAVDEKGEVVDGDKLIYLLTNKLIDEDCLNNNTVVTTIMSNSGLNKALKKIGINTIQTKVGDRYVYEEMKKSNYSIGGEQSGHIIVRKYAATGDGLLTSILVADEMIKRNKKLSELVEPVKLFPQILKNVRVVDKSTTINDEQVQQILKKENKSLKEGRLLLRESGTEPVIRIMAECSTIKECNEHIDNIYNVIKKRGFVCE